MEKGRTVREAVRPFHLSFFRGICGYGPGQGAALPFFQHRKQGPGKGTPRAVENFLSHFFHFHGENVGKRVGCPCFLAAKAVEKNGKDCQGLFRDMDTCRPF